MNEICAISRCVSQPVVGWQLELVGRNLRSPAMRGQEQEPIDYATTITSVCDTHRLLDTLRHRGGDHALSSPVPSQAQLAAHSGRHGRDPCHRYPGAVAPHAVFLAARRKIRVIKGAPVGGAETNAAKMPQWSA